MTSQGPNFQGTNLHSGVSNVLATRKNMSSFVLKNLQGFYFKIHVFLRLALMVVYTLKTSTHWVVTMEFLPLIQMVCGLLDSEIILN